MEEVAEELQDPEHEPDKPYGHHSLPPSWNRPRSWLPDACPHSLTVSHIFLTLTGNSLNARDFSGGKSFNSSIHLLLHRMSAF